jgi:hypothetical protein
MNEKKIWETKEWRDAKKEWEKGIEGNKNIKCEQCGSKDRLTPHHTIPFRHLYFIKIRELAITQMSKEMNFTFYPSAINKTGGFSTSNGYIKVGVLKKYIAENPEIKEKAEKLAKEEYLSFNDIRILCQKCHFAEEKGMVLCEYCNKKYYNPIYFMSCSDCKEKAQEEYKKFEEDMDRIEEETSF